MKRDTSCLKREGRSFGLGEGKEISADFTSGGAKAQQGRGKGIQSDGDF